MRPSSPERSAAALLARRLREGWKSREPRFSLRDLYRHEWTYLPLRTSAAQPYASWKPCWLRREILTGDAASGRPTDRWSINPRIYASAGETSAYETSAYEN